MPIYHNQKLIFIHIPKTAGTSIRNLLDNTFGKCDIIRVDGHDLLKDIYIPDYRTLCVVRDPIERVKSFYKWFRTNNDYDNYPYKKLALRYDFKEWVLQWWLTNAEEQSKYFLIDNKIPANTTIIKYENLNYELRSFFGPEMDLKKLPRLHKSLDEKILNCDELIVKLIRKKERWLYENNFYV